MTSKLVLRDLNHLWRFELKQGTNRVGRHPENDLSISEASISNFHCELLVGGDQVLVRDLGSSNGTFIDSVQVREGILKPGQVLRLGSTELKLDRVEEHGADVCVAIPEITLEQPATHAILSDGAAACLNHPDVPAGFRCTKCTETFCDECIHVVGLRGRSAMRFCPACSGPVEVITPPRAAGQAVSATERIRSMFGKLSKTLRLPFGRGES